MAEGGKKKNDATVPIVIGIGALLLLLLFGGCGQISLPTISTGNWGSPTPTYYPRTCDSRRYDCRGHWDGSGHWVPDQSSSGDEDRGAGHHRRKPRPSDDPDPSEQR